MAEVVDFEEGKRKRDQKAEDEDGAPKRKAGPWESALKRTKWGEPTPTLANASLILSRSEAWRGVLSYNRFAHRIQLLRPPPAHSIEAPVEGMVTEWWDDSVANRARIWLERMYDLSFPKEVVHEAARLVAESTARHPLQDYLVAVAAKWDKSARVDTWLSEYVAVEDSSYVRTVGAKWLLSAVARAFAPGCKVDYVLIIEGTQRGGKSSALRALCPEESWFLETGVELGTKDAFHVIQNKWIVELAELDSMSRGDVSKIKGFISNRVDTYCPRYGRTAIDQPRTNIFGGTVNPPYEYLKDESGGDRWWPVRTKATRENRLDLGKIEKARDQIWGEVVHRYRSGELWYFTEEHQIAAAASEQEARRQEDPWEAKLRPLLASTKLQKRGATTQELLLSIVGEAAEMRATKAESMRMARTLLALGWEKGSKETREDGSRSFVYRPTKVGHREIELAAKKIKRSR
jgi:putative DNA primase/helicase